MRGDQAKTVALTLRDEIVSGQLPPGSRLGQDQLAERFGLSRMPIREALRLLEADGLVELCPNRTAKVSALDLADMIDIFEMRASLESLAIRHAVPLLTDMTIKTASGIQKIMEKAPQRDFGDLNAEFHMALYAPCGRRRLLATIQKLAGLSDRYLRLALTSPAQRQESDEEHEALIAACFQRDAEQAAQIVEKHIVKARSVLEMILEDEMLTGPASEPTLRAKSEA